MFGKIAPERITELRQPSEKLTLRQVELRLATAGIAEDAIAGLEYRDGVLIAKIIDLQHEMRNRLFEQGFTQFFSS
jgi:hypothetical protein